MKPVHVAGRVLTPCLKPAHCVEGHQDKQHFYALHSLLSGTAGVLHEQNRCFFVACVQEPTTIKQGTPLAEEDAVMCMKICMKEKQHCFVVFAGAHDH